MHLIPQRLLQLLTVHTILSLFLPGTLSFAANVLPSLSVSLSSICMALSLSTSSSNPSPIVLIDGFELPKLSSDDVLEVYHLRSAPLPLIRTQIASFTVQSAGLALRSSLTKETIVLEFQPKNFTSCFLPTIVTRELSSSDNSTRLTELVWDKRSQIAYYKKIDMSYWQQSTYLADINGVVYSQYHEWLQEYLAQDRLYTPQTICEDSSLETCYYYSQTWDSFLAHSFQRLASSAVQLSPLSPPAAADLVLMTNGHPVDFTLDDLDRQSNTPLKSSSASLSSSSAEAAITSADVFRYYVDLVNCLSSMKASSESPSKLLSWSSSSPSTATENILEEGDGKSSNENNNNDNNNNNKNNDLDLAFALNQCSHKNVTFVHIDGDHYLKLQARYPYAKVHEYFQLIPEAHAQDTGDDDFFDVFIAVLLLGCMIIGLVAALERLKILHYWHAKIFTIERKRRVSMTAPEEGGYSRSSELPIYARAAGWVQAMSSLTPSLSPLSLSSSNKSSSARGLSPSSASSSSSSSSVHYSRLPGEEADGKDGLSNSDTIGGGGGGGGMMNMGIGLGLVGIFQVQPDIAELLAVDGRVRSESMASSLDGLEREVNSATAADSSASGECDSSAGNHHPEGNSSSQRYVHESTAISNSKSNYNNFSSSSYNNNDNNGSRNPSRIVSNSALGQSYERVSTPTQPSSSSSSSIRSIASVFNNDMETQRFDIDASVSNIMAEIECLLSSTAGVEQGPLSVNNGENIQLGSGKQELDKAEL